MNKKPMAVHEVAKSTGITTRALHYCDEIRYSFFGVRRADSSLCHN